MVFLLLPLPNQTNQDGWTTKYSAYLRPFTIGIIYSSRQISLNIYRHNFCFMHRCIVTDYKPRNLGHGKITPEHVSSFCIVPSLTALHQVCSLDRTINALDFCTKSTLSPSMITRTLTTYHYNVPRNV